MAFYNHQQTYNFFPHIGVPGRIADLAPYVVDTFINGEAPGEMEMGVLAFSPDGKKILSAKKAIEAINALSSVNSSTTASAWETKYGYKIVPATSGSSSYDISTTRLNVANSCVGVTVNGGTNERGLIGDPFIRETLSIGVMRYGRIYAKVSSTAEIKIGETVHLVEPGYLGSEVSDGTDILVNGRFITEGETVTYTDKDTGETKSYKLAVVEIFNGNTISVAEED